MPLIMIGAMAQMPIVEATSMISAMRASSRLPAAGQCIVLDQAIRTRP